MTKAGTFRLDAEAILYAIVSRLESGTECLGDRETNIGASRVGYCARATVLDVMQPAPLPVITAGKFLTGKALENEVIQILRGSLSGRIRATGIKQDQLKHDTAPLICHPDGKVLAPFEGPGGEEMEGDGALEVKTCDPRVFSHYAQDGLPVWYVDQNQVQQGLGNLKWGLMVLANAACLSELVWWVVPFDSTRYDGLVARAIWIKNAEAQGIIPAGEPTRGYCNICRHRRDCAERIGIVETTGDGSVPAGIRAAIEALGDELAEVQAQLAPLLEREEEIKNEARGLVEPLGFKKQDFSSAYIEFRGGGPGKAFDAKAFEKDQPDLFEKYLKPTLKKPAFHFTPKHNLGS